MPPKPSPFAPAERRAWPRIRRLRARAPPRRKRFARASAQLVTLLASAVILCAFVALSRASLFTAQLSSLLESDVSLPSSQRTQARASLSRNVSSVLAADGSLFLVDHHALSIEQTARTHALAAARMTHIVGEREADIAFFMQISDANMAFLPRLLTTLWHPANVYLIHFDNKIDAHRTDAFRTSLQRSDKLRNVHVMASEPITYMGVSMLLNTLSAIEWLLQSHYQWHYFINLSGSDYPLVNILNMRRILGQPHVVERNVSFVQLAPNHTFWQRTKQSRFDTIFYDTSLAMRERAQQNQLLNTRQPHPMRQQLGVHFLQSEAWLILHRSFAHFSVRSAFARKLLIVLSMMKDPEEHFFAMLAWNQPHFNRTLAHHALRGIYWKLNGTSSGQHPYYIDQHMPDGSLPFWDPGVLKSRCFFARKFRHAQSELLERIDRLMSGTHPHADTHAVEKSLTAVNEYVACLCKRDPLWHNILWHPPCNYSEYRSASNNNG
eukprot:TRINITY_DN848_c0_g1_i1.p1 TRINITY_DN848_c0_g1~~TRINITY_DN848_c0_g1_i1.p1  ORF type:complete len:504 (+),score=128.47 TRINITY_DN848_c0_g1_i1:32-1513(+)